MPNSTIKVTDKFLLDLKHGYLVYKLVFMDSPYDPEIYENIGFDSTIMILIENILLGVNDGYISEVLLSTRDYNCIISFMRWCQEQSESEI